MPCNLLPFAMDSGGNYYALNLKNKKIYYYVTDEWANQALFDYEGNALPTLKLIRDFKA